MTILILYERWFFGWLLLLSSYLIISLDAFSWRTNNNNNNGISRPLSSSSSSLRVVVATRWRGWLPPARSYHHHHNCAGGCEQHRKVPASWFSSSRVSLSSVSSSSSSSSASSNHHQQHHHLEERVGYYYSDLDRLERALNRSVAEPHGERHQRLEMLAWCAQQRPAIHEHVIRYGARPWIGSLILVLVLKATFMAPRSPSSSSSVLWKAIMTLSSVHFGFSVVLAPVILLVVLKMTTRSGFPREPPLPRALQNLQEYHRFLSPWLLLLSSSPSTKATSSTSPLSWAPHSSNDGDRPVLMLLELWVTAVVSSRVVWVAQIPWSNGQAMTLPTWARLVHRICTRLAAALALHQFPSLWYQLVRPQQPRPLSGQVWALQTLVGAQAPRLCTACDLALLFSTRPISILLTCYGSSALLLTLLWRWSRTPPRLHPSRTDRRGRWAFLGAALTLAAAQWWSNLRPQAPGWTWSGWRPTTATWLLGLSLVGPLCHIVAWCRNVRVAYMHDVALSSEHEAEWKQLSDPVEHDRRYCWRYRLAWREPQRFHEMVRQQWARFWQWFLLAGGVQDQMRRDDLRQRRRAWFSSENSRTVWQLVANELIEEGPDSSSLPDRSKWKEEAMNRLAQKHQRDYEAGRLEDPLGIAVQQVFGIGLGYISDGSEEASDASLRGLQARAAQSALRRAQAIYDSQAARQALAGIDDPELLRAKKMELRQRAQEEIQYLADRLASLIPTTVSPGGPTAEAQVQMLGLKQPTTDGSVHPLLKRGAHRPHQGAIQQLLIMAEEEEEEEESSVPNAARVDEPFYQDDDEDDQENPEIVVV